MKMDIETILSIIFQKCCIFFNVIDFHSTFAVGNVSCRVRIYFESTFGFALGSTEVSSTIDQGAMIILCRVHEIQPMTEHYQRFKIF